MRSMQVLGVLGGVMVLAACGRGRCCGRCRAAAGAGAGAGDAAARAGVGGTGPGRASRSCGAGDRRLALVADSDAKRVRMLDTKAEQELPRDAARGMPAQLVVAGGRARLRLGARPGRGRRARGATSERRRPRCASSARVATAEEPTGLSPHPRRPHAARRLRLGPRPRRLLDARRWSTGSASACAREPRAVVTQRRTARWPTSSHATASLVSVVDLDGARARASTPSRLDAAGLREHDGQQLQWRQGYALARTEFGILAPGRRPPRRATRRCGPRRTAAWTPTRCPPRASRVARRRIPHAPGGRGDADGPPSARWSASSRQRVPPAARGGVRRARASGSSSRCAGAGPGVAPRRAPAAERGARQAVWQVGGEPTGARDRRRPPRRSSSWSQRVAHA